MTYPIVVVPDDTGDLIEQLGTKRKFWFDNSRRLYKQGRPGTGEDWAEKVACEICGLLDLPHANYQLGVWRGEPGIVSESFLPKGWRLVHGNELLANYHPAYLDPKRYERRQHTVSAVLGITAGWIDLRIEPPPGFLLTPPLRIAADVMVGYLMLDCLIGNQDRHDENWALMVKPSRPLQIALAPSYDHASSLGRNESDARRRSILSTKGRLESYCARARSAFYIHPSNTKPASTLEAFAAAKRRRGAAVKFRLERLDGLATADIDTIFQEIPTNLISATAIEFASRVLEVNKARLLGLAARQSP